MSSHSQQDTSKKQDKTGNEDLRSKIRDTFPVVEYSTQLKAGGDVNPKSEKYNKYKVLYPNITEDSEEVSFVDWEAELTPLPIEKSQIVILGKVIDVQAHLSSNKNSVYSEFKIEIEKVFKNSSQQKFKDGKYISAEREGGIVSFPSGYKTWYRIAGQIMPKTGQKYLFFLTHDFPMYGQKQDLFLLTGYELRDGRVFPLDNPGGGTHSIAKFYAGKEVSVLLDDLQNALEKSTNVLPK